MVAAKGALHPPATNHRRRAPWDKGSATVFALGDGAGVPGVLEEAGYEHARARGVKIPCRGWSVAA